MGVHLVVLADTPPGGTRKGNDEMEEYMHHMTADQKLLTAVTQAFIMVALLAAIWFTHKCSRQNRNKQWRLLGISVWLIFGLLVSIAQVVVLIIGCPPLPVMRTLLWLDRTVLVAGYIFIAVTSWQLMKLYAKGK